MMDVCEMMVKLVGFYLPMTCRNFFINFFTQFLHSQLNKKNVLTKFINKSHHIAKIKFSIE